MDCETKTRTYLSLTLSEFEAGVLKTIINRIEIDDSTEADTREAEDLLIQLYNVLGEYDAVDFPIHYHVEAE